jgi:hypothetical protein
MMGVAPEVIRKFVRPEALAQFHLDESVALTYLLTLMATRREFKPLRMRTLRRHLKLAPAPPIFLKGQAGADDGGPGADANGGQLYHAVVDLERPLGARNGWRWLRWMKVLGARGLDLQSSQSADEHR